jgi:hypothetical protein
MGCFLNTYVKVIRKIDALPWSRGGFFNPPALTVESEFNPFYETRIGLYGCNHGDLRFAFSGMIPLPFVAPMSHFLLSRRENLL